MADLMSSKNRTHQKDEGSVQSQESLPGQFLRRSIPLNGIPVVVICKHVTVHITNLGRHCNIQTINISLSLAENYKMLWSVKQSFHSNSKTHFSHKFFLHEHPANFIKRPFHKQCYFLKFPMNAPTLGPIISVVCPFHTLHTIFLLLIFIGCRLLLSCVVSFILIGCCMSDPA